MASDGFNGFPPKALTFFRQLRRNNTREWFQPRKAIYDEQVRALMFELVALVNDDLRKFAVEHVHADPRKAVYRIHRDTRFSKDKTPYKTHVGALFPRAGLPKHGGANYYFGVSDEGVEIAAGMYMPGPPELAAVRALIAADVPAFEKLIGAKAVANAGGALQGERLARVPKGYAADHPAAAWLKFKQLYFFTTLPAKLALERSVRHEIVNRFKALTSVVDFLNAASLPPREQAGDDDSIPRRPPPMF